MVTHPHLLTIKLKAKAAGKSISSARLNLLSIPLFGRFRVERRHLVATSLRRRNKRTFR
jgi:hypothetical protein